MDEEIRSEKGLLDLLNAEVKEDRLYEPLHYRGKTLEFAFLHSSRSYGETYFSFVNGPILRGWGHPPLCI